MLPLVLLMATYTDADLLGSDRWTIRERAERRLAAMGPVAWPVLLTRREDANPETRERVFRLLTPYRVAVLDADARAVLAGERVPTPGDLYYDAQLRLRLHRLALDAGMVEERLKPLHPDREVDSSPWWGPPAWYSCWVAYEEARNWCGRVAPAPREK